MVTLVLCLICLLAGFGIGFLVFRNNQQKINEAEEAAAEVVQEVKATAKKVRKTVKKVTE